MVFRNLTVMPARAAGLIPLALVWALTGCSIAGPEIEDNYQPALHYERFPINVAKGTVKLEVSTRKAALSSDQEGAVRRFAQQAVYTRASEVVVQRPGGGVASDAVAGRVTQILVAEGVPPQAIVNVNNQGGKGAPVVVTFQRKFTVTSECGDWSDNLAKTGNNDPAPNFGCAQQNNIAAIIANPEDLQTPAAETPSDPMRRYQVFVDYRFPKSTATQPGATESAKVSEVAK